MTKTMADIIAEAARTSDAAHWPEAVEIALTAAGYGLVTDAKREALEDLLAPESLERARKVVEDELIDWRDSGLFTLRNNGLAVRNKDGSGSEIIRFGFEDGLRIAIKDHAARAAEMRQG